MHASPRALEDDVPQVTGIACPDCCGALAVRAEGHERNLSFLCRIGHTYDVTELLAAKEETLEDRLWSAVTGFEELAAFLEDLTLSEDGRRAYPASFHDRLGRAQLAIEDLREVVRMNRPVDLAPAEPVPPMAEPPIDRAGEP